MKEIKGAAAVVLHEGRVLLVQRRNPPDAGLWGYPGGHAEDGESDAAAAIRELHEETGVSATAGPLLTTLYVGDPARRLQLAMVRCAYLSGNPVANDDALCAEWVAIRNVLTPDRAYSDRVADVLSMAMEG